MSNPEMEKLANAIADVELAKIASGDFSGEDVAEGESSNDDDKDSNK